MTIDEMKSLAEELETVANENWKQSYEEVKKFHQRTPAWEKTRERYSYWTGVKNSFHQAAVLLGTLSLIEQEERQ